MLIRVLRSRTRDLAHRTLVRQWSSAPPRMIIPTLRRMVVPTVVVAGGLVAVAQLRSPKIRPPEVAPATSSDEHSGTELLNKKPRWQLTLLVVWRCVELGCTLVPVLGRYLIQQLPLVGSMFSRCAGIRALRIDADMRACIVSPSLLGGVS